MRGGRDGMGVPYRHGKEKKSGEWRFCIDFRRLNNVTKKSTHPLPRMDTTLDGLAGSTRFPFLDIKSAYWQVAVHPDD